ncbi:ABC transporter permease, partial [Mycobacterium tuberculosis]
MRHALKEFSLPVFAIAAALLLFGLVAAFAGVDAVDVWTTLFKG